MNLLGVNLALLMGPTVPLPAIQPIVQALESVEINHNDQGSSGFQIIFKANRGGPMGQVDYPLSKMPQIKMFNRVIIIVMFKVSVPTVLMDGIITNLQLTPSNGNQDGYITITGEDLSVLMDLKEKTAEHPAQSEFIIANKIIATYAEHGLIPRVTPPIMMDVPAPTERIPVQRGTDLAYLREMATRFGYRFYVKPGPLPGMNMGYWGPPERIGLLQAALSVDMGAHTNVDTISFSNDGLAPALVDAKVQDRRANVKLPLMTFAAKRIPPLAREPSLFMNFSKVRRTLPNDLGGLSYPEAFARSQGKTDFSVDNVVTATGELDAMTYGHMLQAPGIVGVRGAGDTHDGIYYVKRVVHKIREGTYRQSFELTREGTGTITPLVRP